MSMMWSFDEMNVVSSQSQSMVWPEYQDSFSSAIIAVTIQ